MSKISPFKNFMSAVQQAGGWKGAFLQLYRTDQLKYGALVGTDKFGNKYFQNKAYFMGRSRWVEYADQFGMDYDASQVPPEWHRWLHYIGDHPPESAKYPEKKWMQEYQENKSGTSDEYVPYSTTRPKIESWTPPKH